jgi:hypothetical protein
LFDCMGLFIRSAACRRQEGCWHSHSSNKFNAAPAASFNPIATINPTNLPK